jgi:hypothetical protein
MEVTRSGTGGKLVMAVHAKLSDFVTSTYFIDTAE